MEFEKKGHNIELEVDYSRFGNDEDADFRSTGSTSFTDYKDFVDTKRTQTVRCFLEKYISSGTIVFDDGNTLILSKEDDI